MCVSERGTEQPVLEADGRSRGSSPPGTEGMQAGRNSGNARKSEAGT